MSNIPAPEIITGCDQFRAGLGAIVTDWFNTEDEARAEYERLWNATNGTNLDEDVPMDEPALTLESAVGVVHDGIELLDCVESIYFEATTGRMKVETDEGSFYAVVSLQDPDEPNSADKLSEEHGYWSSHATCSLADWQYEVANGDTRASYWEWVANKLQADAAYESAVAAQKERESDAS